MAFVLRPGLSCAFVCVCVFFVCGVCVRECWVGLWDSYERKRWWITCLGPLTQLLPSAYKRIEAVPWLVS